MLSSLAKLFRASEPAPLPAVPRGTRVYAIGDIHGCLAQFEALIGAIEADDARRGAAETSVVLLGDLVDRGPDSAGVVRRARAWAASRRVRHIAGNHEEMFLESFADSGVLKHFLRYGGRETILSYGVDPKAFRVADIEQTRAMIAAAVPAEDRAWLASAEDTIEIGDYLFVHAGIRPEVPLGDQEGRDLRWIREPFLSHPDAHGPVVVHGHTISEEIELRTNRIGLDTGAYASGRLTALGLEGTERWLIEAALADGAIQVTHRDIR